MISDIDETMTIKAKFTEKEFLSLLKNPQKDVRVFKAPAQGLILTQVDYE